MARLERHSIASQDVDKMLKASILLVAMVAMGAVRPGRCYSAGAPTDACEDMMPQHYADAQTKSFPYNMQVSRKAIRSGDEIQFTVTGKGANDKIRGFMIQARQGERRVGRFLVDPKDPFVQTLDCNKEVASAVTHKKHDEKNDTKSLTVTWVAPKDFKGEVTFRSTIALNGGVFWVGQPSNAVKVH